MSNIPKRINPKPINKSIVISISAHDVEAKLNVKRRILERINSEVEADRICKLIGVVENHVCM